MNNLDLNERDLKIIAIALERSVNYVTDKEYLFTLINRVKNQIDEFNQNLEEK